VSAALRAVIASCVVYLGGCESLLGLKDIVPDGAATKLSFNSPAIRGVAQQPLDVIAVSVLDIQGNPAQGFTGEVKLTIGTNPGGASLIGIATAAAPGGIARFDAVGIDRPAAGYTLVASADGLESATSLPLDVVVPAFKPIATGLGGGAITGLVISPAPPGGTTSVFAAASNGVYKSADGGASWKPASFGADASARLLADPLHAGVVYSVSFSGTNRIKKTSDGGATWHGLDLGNNNFASTFDIDPKNPSIIYAAGGRLLRSADAGASWSPVSVPGSCSQIAIDPVTTSTIYCTGYDQVTGQPFGILKSSDSGANWGAANSGLSSLQVGQLHVTPEAIFVTAGNTLQRSSDAAASWTTLSIGFANTLAYAPSMPKRIYISQGNGIAVSNDAGATFGASVLISNTDSVQTLAVDPTNPNVVYAGGFNHGVYVSSNGGVSWSAAATGIDAPRIASVALVPGVPGAVLASAGGTVLRSTNSGTSWTTSAPFEATLRFDPIVSTRVYACSFGAFFTSTNSGVSFVQSTSGPNGCTRLLIAGTTFFAVGNGRVFKSTNSGTTWVDTGLGTAPPGFYVNDAALGDATGNVVLATTSDGLYRSTNGGTSFTRTAPPTSMNTLTTDPKVATRIVAGLCPGFRVSNDGGASFGSDIGGPCVQTLMATGSALYAYGSSSTAVLSRSTDGGTTWVPIEITGSIPNGANINSITATDDGTTLYLGTQAGLYKNAGP